MRFFVTPLIGLYLFLNFLVFVFHPLSGVLLSLSHITLPAGIVDGRAIWYPRVATFARIVRDEDPAMRKKDAIQLGLQETVYEARVKNILKQTHVDIPKKNLDDPLAGVVELSRLANVAVFASSDFQVDVKTRLEGLRSRIVDDGLPFGDAAMKYSEHLSASLNGDLGILNLANSEDWMKPLFLLDEDELSGIVDGPEAYWLFLVRTKEIKDDNVFVRASAIAFNKKSLPTILSKLAKNNRPWIFVW